MVAPGEEGLQQRIADEIAFKWFGPSARPVNVGPLAVNYFSFIFPVEIADGAARARLFVKIPKTDLRRQASAAILPFSEGDRSLAREEYASLCHLATAWPPDDLGVQFVRPIGYLDEYNAIVTERADAQDGHEMLLRLDRARLLRRRRSDEPVHLLGRVGAALRRFHDRSRHAATFEGRAALPKLRRYCDELAAFGVSRRVCARAIAVLDRCLQHYQCPAWRTTTLKGLDVRNVLVDGAGAVVMLDPGKMKDTCREADLARFVLTWRILYWGSPLFACRIQPSQAAEAAFLQGYFGEECRDRKLLAVFLVKEILKHWHTAHDSLRLKAWPPVVRRLTGRLYVDPFYTAQLASELRHVDA